MEYWRDTFGADADTTRHRVRTERRQLLRTYSADEAPPDYPSKEVTRVALRLKYQIEQVISYEVGESQITDSNSRFITDAVVQTARQAGGEDYQACVLFCLLVCLRWFRDQATAELWDSDLNGCRAVACEVIAKRIIETEESQIFLLRDCLLKRFSTFCDGKDTAAANVIERAVDLHALRVIGSSGYQKCIRYLWRGWFCQDEGNPTNFIVYAERDNIDFWAHFHPDRMRSPVYRNVCEIAFSSVYLVLYTIVMSTVSLTGDLDVVETVLYIMTLAYICDEVAKLWKIGRHHFTFWFTFNSILYAFLVTSFVLRMVALSRLLVVQGERQRFNTLSYNFLALAGPMFWMRMMLYLDTFRFFGAMFMVLRAMMKESLIFFALLLVVLIGFFQAFMGMTQVDAVVPPTRNIIQGMANSIMQSPEFGTFQDFAFPFGIILYYMFNFIVMTILLNILIALYNSSYDEIASNAVDEYMGLFALKTMQFVRAPDENVFIPPFNLVEIVFLVLPFEWWLPWACYSRLNNIVMGTIYSPLLLFTAWLEAREARRIRRNRRYGRDDDDDITTREWEHAAEEIDYELDATWRQAVNGSTPVVQTYGCSSEVRQLKEQVEELTKVVKILAEKDKS